MNNIETLVQNLASLSDTLNVNPTVIYNEGWMTRLLICQSTLDNIDLNGIKFSDMKKWSSEAVIKSPFMGPALKQEKKNETYTHPDIILGDFDVDYENNAAIKVKNDASQIGIIEAKMGSNLSQEVTNASDYNQASRSIACLAYNVNQQESCKIFFIVVAPKKTINKYNINNQISKVASQIDNRCANTNYGTIKNKAVFNKHVSSCTSFAVSFEEWIKLLKDGTAKEKIEDFYNKCLTYNKI